MTRNHEKYMDLVVHDARERMEKGSTLKTRNLSGATLYSSMEPCPMCLSTTILEVNIKQVVLGARHARLGRKDLGGYSAEAFWRTPTSAASSSA